MVAPSDFSPSDVAAVAAQMMAVLGTGHQIAPLSEGERPVDLAAAYRVTRAVRDLRQARGEMVIGRKIGFTNRTIWAEYGVFAAIWGYIYDRTVHDLADLEAGFALDGLAEPRIEPEIMFGLAKAPAPDMDEAALLACVDWVAHGFELVQSIYPGWKFAAPDTVAGFGLHGALFIGERHDVKQAPERWLRQLSTFEIDLLCDGELVDHGRAANVLDGPLSALHHLVRVLAQDPDNPPLAPGEIVTTGTLTRAFPILPGQHWQTRLTGSDLPPAVLRSRRATAAPTPTPA